MRVLGNQVDLNLFFNNHGENIKLNLEKQYQALASLDIKTISNVEWWFQCILELQE